MSSKNIIIALVCFASCALAIEHFGTIKENFAGLNNPMTVIKERVYESGNQKGNFFEIPGSYQASLSPRSAGMVDYGPYIRYNLPNVNNMASNPNAPLSAQTGGCSQNTIITEHFNHQGNNLQPQQYTQLSDIIPVQQQQQGLNALGENMTQPIIYDRLIYANQRSRLRAEGDPIRGDLPIVPLQKGWFSPGNAHPQTALRDGALAALGGINNDTTKELLALQSAATLGEHNTGSGINYSVQKSMYNNPAGEIHVTAFP